jgi:hypothetical protein
MSEREEVRARILECFGVTEEDIAAIDDGYTEAMAEARAYEEAFKVHLRERAQVVSDELSRRLLDADRITPA